MRHRRGSPRPATPSRSRRDDDGFVLANGHLRAVLGRDGTLRSLVHRAERPRGAAGARQRARALRGPPDRLRGVGPRPVPSRDARATARRRTQRRGRRAPTRCGPSSPFERPIGGASRMRQVVRLDAGAARLEFHCAIDWREERRALKVALPGRRARAARDLRDAVRRGRAPDALLDAPRRSPSTRSPATASPTSPSTASASRCSRPRPTAGRSLGSEMRMTLLRSPRWPDPRRRRRRARAGLRDLPARRRLAGGRRDRGGAALQRAAAARRREPRRRARSSRPTRPALLIDTVKRAEDSDALIVRLYEAHGGRGTARLRVGVPFGGVRSPTCSRTACAGAEVDGDEVLIPFRPVRDRHRRARRARLDCRAWTSTSSRR